MWPESVTTALVSTGIGGIIAFIVMNWKREDDRARLRERDDHTKELAAMFARMEQHAKSALEIVQSNTAAMVALRESQTAAMLTIQRALDHQTKLTRLAERVERIENERYGGE